MGLPTSLTGLLVTMILVGYISGNAYTNYGQTETIKIFQQDVKNSLNNVTSADNPIYATVAIGATIFSTFYLAVASMNNLVEIYVLELPADFYIITVIFTMGIIFAIIRYVRGMWDR